MANPINVLLTGGSHFHHFQDGCRVVSALEQLVEREGPIRLLLPAGERGAAWEAWTWATYNEVTFALYNPRCTLELAGARSQSRPDIVLAFQGAPSATLDVFRADGAVIIEVNGRPPGRTVL